MLATLSEVGPDHFGVVAKDVRRYQARGSATKDLGEAVARFGRHFRILEEISEDVGVSRVDSDVVEK